MAVTTPEIGPRAGSPLSPDPERSTIVAALPDIPASDTLAARVRDLLESAIINGTLKPGERLHADKLATRFGMSHIPVREALRSLHEAGWVDIKPRHGVRVREWSPRELGELFEFRAVVEAQIARWAAQRRTAEDLETLAEIVRVGQSAVTSGQPAGTASEFHQALRAAAHNSVIQATSDDLEKRARFYFSTVADELGASWRNVHAEVFKLVERQDAEAAARVAKEHIERTGEAVRALLFPGE
jgi:DNA-binding GntR family transcriptional regulator